MEKFLLQNPLKLSIMFIPCSIYNISIISDWPFLLMPGHLAQSGASLTMNQGIAGSSPGPPTFFR